MRCKTSRQSATRSWFRLRRRGRIGRDRRGRWRRGRRRATQAPPPSPTTWQGRNDRDRRRGRRRRGRRDHACEGVGTCRRRGPRPRARSGEDLWRDQPRHRRTMCRGRTRRRQGGDEFRRRRDAGDDPSVVRASLDHHNRDRVHGGRHGLAGDGRPEPRRRRRRRRVGRRRTQASPPATPTRQGWQLRVGDDRRVVRGDRRVAARRSGRGHRWRSGIRRRRRGRRRGR